MPTATAGRCDAPSRQFRRHLPRRHASVGQFGQDRPELTGTLYCFGPMSWCQPISAIAAETNAAGFCRRERGLGSCGDHFALMLGNGRENMQRQAGRMRVSTATNSTPESINAAMKARFRERRSSLAMTSRALRLRQRASAR